MKRSWHSIFGLVAVGFLTACAQTGQDIYDPFEAENRKRHEFNKRVDEKVLSKAGSGYASALSEQDQEIIKNFSDNLGQPSVIVNRVLQLKFVKALSAAARLTINTAFGFGGMFDPATEMGLTKQSTDFGVTMGVWGVPEGAYLEVPYMGPSTVRDTFGRGVNLVFDPAYYILPRYGAYGKLGIDGLAVAGTRAEFDGLVTDLLYNSEDSYASARLYYLQNRRFAVTGEVPAEDDFLDPTDQEEDFSDFDDFYE